ncbi:MAG: tungsten formylmethanofuran dehydrogenase [Rhizobiaceae bacterium]
MAVAWIGNREASLAHAVEEAALLLEASKCPVILLDTDIHGTRASVALAEQIGAVYDVADGGSSAVEAALIMDRGAMTIAPGEVRRRADMLVFVGPVPEQHVPLVGDLASSAPDLSGGGARKLFAIGGTSKRGLPDNTVPVNSSRTGLPETLAAIRASMAGKSMVGKFANFEMFVAALAAAIFPVFIYSGEAGLPALEMLQGLVADLNKTKRASTLHLAGSDNGWGAVLASTWMTGFAPRTSFARGFPEFDPWRFDVERMIAAGEADLVLSVGSIVHFDIPTPNPSPQGGRALGDRNASAKPQSSSQAAIQPASPSPLRGGVRGGDISQNTAQPAALTRIALASGFKPVPGSAITISIGTPGIDNDTVGYSVRLGTIVASRASAPSDLPSAATILRLLHERLRGKAAA